MFRNWNSRRFFCFGRFQLKGKTNESDCETYPQIRACNRLAVRREFIEILDVGQEQIQMDCRFQASPFRSPPHRFPTTKLSTKTSSRDEYRTVFQYFQAWKVTSSSPLIVRPICTDNTTVQYPVFRRCVILFCYCPVLRSPGNSDGSGLTAIDFEIKWSLRDD